MKKIFTFLLVASTMISISQEINQYNSKGEKEGEWINYYYNEDTSNNGVYVRKRISKGNYINNQMDGLWIDTINWNDGINRNFKTVEKRNYKNGLLDGKSFIYDEKNELLSFTIYCNNECIETIVYENKKIVYTSKNIKGVGYILEDFEYYKNGKLKSKKISKSITETLNKDITIMYYNSTGKIIKKKNYIEYYQTHIDLHNI